MEPREQAAAGGLKAGSAAAEPASERLAAVGRSALAGRRALVVGGSGGIGAAVARGLASRGASVLVHGRSPASVGAVVATIRSAGGQAEGLALPLESAAPLLAAIRHAGPFDILAVAFGPFVRKPLAAHSPEDWERMASLNLALPGALVSALFPAMCDRGFGRILLFGGTRTDAIRGYRSNAAYAAAKTGLGVLAKSAAIEGAPRNVAAVAVCPGLVRTEYVDDAAAEALRLMAPGGRLSSPVEVAEIALGLIDRDPCAASGAIVSLDAGFDP